MKANLFIYSLFAAGILIACGDESSSSPNDASIEQNSSSSIVNNSESSDSNQNEQDDFSSSSIASSNATILSSSSAIQSSSDQKDLSSSSTVKGFPANYNAETGLLTDERDGEVYTTAKIGDQIWMGQNLRYYTEEPAEGCEYTYNDLTEDVPNLSTYGRTYSWIGATRIPCDYISKKATFGSEEFPLPHQGLCPKGWHIPSLEEWKIMIEAIDSQLYKLLSTGWSGEAFDYAGTDDYGFNVLKPLNGISVLFIMLDNGGRAQTMVFDNMAGATVQLETAYIVKTVYELYLRCLMD
ncbi:FISUMP domain-containing protein [Fibrobacter sp. UWB10]|uniref:FISUMP domain-containing protein n=1 Tax=Fibrobacter sp. UWB10 TaxID=1896201 RepID=UPI00240337C9|nr:FISUMP domain-containing protein [Fibrobacter sp. UWB10]SMP46363.1 major paralogous domain-containing protein [Fibrobacter sp. UWB10]